LWGDERILAAVYPGPATQLLAARIVCAERNANLLGALAVAVNDVLWRNLGEAPVLAPSEVAASRAGRAGSVSR
jgi:hypothetical protein